MSEGGEENRRAQGACFEKATELLARRPHFRSQLAAKLVRRGFARESVEDVCDRLEALGYLDDLAVARSLASGELRRKGYAPRRVRAELARRGAPEEVVDRVVEEAAEGGEMELAREVAAKWVGRNLWDRTKLARHLERRGFASGTILTILETTGEPGGSENRRESD
jgi:regulatory protein